MLYRILLLFNMHHSSVLAVICEWIKKAPD